MLVNLNKVLIPARKNGYALPAFNFNNLEFLQALTEAAGETKSPIILQTSEGAIDYMGLEYIEAMVDAAAKKTKIPLVLHLDHGKDLKLIKKIITSGFYTSVMFDGSALSYEENIAQTKQVVKWAHAKKMSVEAELGILKGIEDKVSAAANIFTNPLQAADFVKKTGCDALAVAIGTSHGAYKFSGTGKLDLARLKEIAKLVKIPLVLHGASGVPQKLLNLIKFKCDKIGDCERLGGAKGVPDAEILGAIKLGVAKINIDTDLRVAFTAGVRNTLLQDLKVFDPRKYLGAGKEKVKKTALDKIKLFKS
ncbi:MAG: Fructose-1,6-bisphosphate aldolase, class II [Candidatus Magasanikbacteria bacterium GW2011_GWC2_40_17]|uniref:Fructose-1,6-bisphosphate aldolase, class II n=1 Tax=Candidatus Magasanikbacteria bacterium GW2011_GWA2_42_32 TaxID=1619039 RepID=A0A0G1A8E6_9BACT|nr:MAG: Fructose-1,6-bisphosphate aldolase, class II [Candidatus Magasanikbacteria bacterium GW2011_GWC2_40_17]KKS57305.1 MAG: Fructose-1,6-bisphosphate aldolase, class II [Candidatus Magasanikbacteria bacterium GW2011_GWA2_42_32]OGH85790.1 MAG: fructose-1,6-bisphosphate aldolase, class II [Candidatus Magasanikbacteria bacterium RIFOXYB2_FULL_38_10]